MIVAVWSLRICIPSMSLSRELWHILEAGVRNTIRAITTSHSSCLLTVVNYLTVLYTITGARNACDGVERDNITQSYGMMGRAPEGAGVHVFASRAPS